MIYLDLSDADLIILIKNDDILAYNEIYQRYKWPLFLHAIKRINDREEARDIVQDLFIHLWDKRTSLNIHGQVSGYLYAAIRNRVIKFVARQHVASKYIGTLAEAINSGVCLTDHLVREKNLATLIEQAINDLPIKMREVFVLSRKQHLSHREIAERLGIEESTVKRQVSNALKILKDKLGLIAWIFMLIRY